LGTGTAAARNFAARFGKSLPYKKAQYNPFLQAYKVNIRGRVSSRGPRTGVSYSYSVASGMYENVFSYFLVCNGYGTISE
jgi:hypothetical protein